MVLLTIPPRRPLAPTFQRGGWWAEPFGAIPGPCPRISLGPPSLLLKAREALDAVGVQHASVTVWRCPCLTSDLYNSRKTQRAVLGVEVACPRGGLQRHRRLLTPSLPGNIPIPRRPGLSACLILEFFMKSPYASFLNGPSAILEAWRDARITHTSFAQRFPVMGESIGARC
jgi:hypothetical protein